nr:DUF2515 family protein [Litchfieldia alkalitelluris]
MDTRKGNLDNISRTVYYQNYYRKNKEVSWAYLASMVSRNAGWSMTDLFSKPFCTLLPKEKRHHLFITYERANWFIFSDAFPQLKIYELSKKVGEPLFHLMEEFDVSQWMIHEWSIFWETGDLTRLLHALIVNEQHLIQEPVIESPFFYKKVFHELDYVLQEKMHFSAVLLPTIKGKLYGISIKNFLDVNGRIELGKKLGWILLESPEKKQINAFFENQAHTGSRKDYQLWQKGLFPHTPPLRLVYPYVYHEDNKREDWSQIKRYKPNKSLSKAWNPPKKYDLSYWYRKKQLQISVAAGLKGLLIP